MVTKVVERPNKLYLLETQKAEKNEEARRSAELLTRYKRHGFVKLDEGQSIEIDKGNGQMICVSHTRVKQDILTVRKSCPLEEAGFKAVDGEIDAITYPDEQGRQHLYVFDRRKVTNLRNHLPEQVWTYAKTLGEILDGSELKQVHDTEDFSYVDDEVKRERKFPGRIKKLWGGVKKLAEGVLEVLKDPGAFVYKEKWFSGV